MSDQEEDMKMRVPILTELEGSFLAAIHSAGEPITGLDARKIVAKNFGETKGPGSFYPALDRMTEEELLNKNPGKDKRSNGYTTTQKGYETGMENVRILEQNARVARKLLEDSTEGLSTDE
jgi:DNA-binding PadR family transcriptional regulator